MKLLHENTIHDSSGLVVLRSKMRAVSRRMKFSESTMHNIELVGTEMFTNQLKFASGSGFVQIWENHIPGKVMELFALDYGPGIHDLKKAAVDGYSTANTMGKGLGTITRLAHEYEFYSMAESLNNDAAWHGTALWARFYVDKQKDVKPYQYGCYLRPYQDDVFNGDAIYFSPNGSALRWLHLDGLGHGKEAADTVEGMERVLDVDDDMQKRLVDVSQQLRGTRGAVGIMSEVNVGRQAVKLCGVGDMSTWLVCNGSKRSIQFSPGILGHEHRSFETSEISFPPQALLITASDGIRRNWELDTYPGLWRLHPQFLALFLGYMLGRNNDDKSLVCIRTRQENHSFTEEHSYGQ
jgi:anti-sigma regulatory factor (Ser/Thr protein kinase)